MAKRINPDGSITIGIIEDEEPKKVAPKKAEPKEEKPTEEKPKAKKTTTKKKE